MKEDVIRAQAGDKKAFIRLIHSMEPRLYNVSRSILKNDEDCADAAQEAIIKAYKGLASLKNPDFFGTWLIRILINECNKIWNVKQKYYYGEVAEQRDYPMDNIEEKIELREAVNKLKHSFRIVVVLYYFEDLPVKQIAEILDTSEGVIKSRLHQARACLNQMLNSAGERKMNYGY